MQGIVSMHNRMTGWGFIVPDDLDAPDFFVHCKSIQGDKNQRFLREGQRVEFEPRDTDSKPQAKNVRKLPTLIARQVSSTAVQQ
jgi:cold shock CspA family protein